jgi:hypothetical protein
MSTITCTLFWVLAPLFILGAAIAWFVETDCDRVRRWRQAGVSYAEIGRRSGLTVYRVKKLAAA